MESSKEFMQRFLREKGEMDQENCERSIVLHRKFFTDEYVNRLPGWYAQMEPENVVSVETSNSCVYVVTAKTVTMEKASHELRHRYQLKHSGTGWQIYCIELACTLCQGTGRRGTADCPLCKGAVWKDYGPQSA